MTRRLGSMTLVALWFLHGGLRAQESASSGIVGQVVDSTKGAMPGATVTVTNVGTNAQRVVDHRRRRPILGPEPAAGDLHRSRRAVRLPDGRAQGLTLRNGEIARPDDHARPRQRLRKRDRRRHVAAAADDQRVGQPDDHAEADRGPAGRRPQPAVVRLALGGRDAAGLQSRHAVRRGGQQPQPVRHRRRRPRQLDELRHRRRLRSLAALQQPVAEPAARRRAGSERAPQLVHHRVRPGPGGRLDRDQIGLEPAARLRLRLHPQRRLEADNYFGQKPATATSPAPRAAGRSCKNEFFVFGGYEGLRTTAGGRCSRRCRARRCWRATSRRSRRRSSIRSPASRFPATSSRRAGFSNFAKTLGADRSGAEQRRREQLPDGPRTSPTTPTPRRSAAIRSCRTTTCFSGSCTTRARS